MSRAPAGAAKVTGSRTPTLFLRLEFGGTDRIGPGKVALLEAIVREGSISAAARAMGMSYRRAWLLIDTMNRMFREPVVLARPGRGSGPSTELTPFGNAVVARFREAEAAADRACKPLVDTLVAGLKTSYRPPRARRERNQG